MGNGAGTMGQSGLTLPAGNRKFKTWQKLKPMKLSHIAMIRMQGGSGNRLWNTDRREREPWKTILNEARDKFEIERERIQDAMNDGEASAEFLSAMRGEVAPAHLKRNAREVWVFISSTFTDMKLERNLLMEDVYPYVRDYTRQIGMEFNAVDMRWGIRQTVCDAHMASDICLEEVARCRENSVGPFFVCILGQKYGFRPIQYRIPQVILEPLIEYMRQKADTDKQQGEALKHIRQWFLLDTNSIKAEYVLQPITWKFPNQKNDAKQRDDWWALFTTMRSAIFAAVKNMSLNPKIKEEILRSITEGEIAEAIEGNHETDHNRFHFFKRNFTNFDLKNAGTQYYIDQADGQLDNEAQTKLENLMTNISDTISSDRIQKYSLRFYPDSDAMYNDSQNREKLKSFLDNFCDYLVKSVHKGALSLMSSMDNPLFSEVISHSIFCRERADLFAGRENLIRGISAYLKLPHGLRPFVVHGCGGCGKTSLLAKVISQSLDSWEGCNVGRPIYVMRFIAITPNSSNIRDLLYFICLQLSYCLNLDLSKVPTEYKLLTRRFVELLGKASAEKPIMIFLDSLDQLTNENEGRDLHWLCPVLPKHVHLIVTIRPNAGGALSAMRNLVKNEDSYFEIVRLDEQDQHNIIDLMLSKSGRSLTPDQKQIVLHAHHDETPTPLFMRLACDIAKKWKSYTPLKECKLADSTPGLIEQLFNELEVKHGEIFVRHALGYLTASATGLSANELIDVLSCDDVVLDDVFEFHIPPIRRLPPLLWTRLRLDLGDYLVEGGVDNVVVYRWYHRLFYEKARQLYLSDSAALLHQALAMYFLGRWADTPKPYREKGSGNMAVTHRGVQSQPLVISSGSATRHNSVADIDSLKTSKSPKKIHWNLRKLTELPRHIIRGNLWEDADREMCSIPWLEAKCRTGRIYKLLLELAEAADKCEFGGKLKDFYRMVRSNASMIQKYPQLICQQALNEPDSSSCSAYAKDYLTVHGKNMFTWLDLSKEQCHGAEIMTLTHTAPVALCQFSKNCKYLATFCQDNTIRVWRVASGALEVTVEGEPIKMEFAGHCYWLAVLEKTGVKLLGLGQGGYAKGKFSVNIPLEIDTQVTVFIPKTNRHIYIVTFGRLYVYGTHDGKLIQRKELKCRPKAVTFMPSGKMIAIAYKDVYLWDIAKETDTKHFETENLKGQLNNTSLRFSQDGRKLLGVLPNGTYRWVVKGNKTKTEGHKLSLHSQGANNVISHNLEFIANLVGDSDLKVLRLYPTVEWCLLQGHIGPVLSADFGETMSDDLLLATGSQDKSVRIWDTANMTGSVTDKDLNHDGPVQSCVYSSDGRHAVTSCEQNEDHWLWSVTKTPPNVVLQLRSGESCRPGKLLCMSDDFVASACNGSDFDIWNINSPRLAINNRVIKGMHRLIPYVNPHYIFTIFREALLTCFTTSNRPGMLYLYEVLPERAIQDWKLNPLIVPGIQDYPQDVKEFKHSPDLLITSAALDAESTMLVTLSFQMTDEQKRASIIKFDKLEFYRSSALLQLWDVHRQRVLRKFNMPTSECRLHQVEFLMDKCVVFYQRCSRRTDASMKTRQMLRGKGQQSEEKTFSGVIDVFNKHLEGPLETISMPGSYSGILAPAQGYINPNKPLLKQLQGVIANHISDGALHSSKVGLNQPVGTFMLPLAKVTSFDFSPDNQSAMVGFDTGYVHFLRMYNAVGNNYYK